MIESIFPGGNNNKEERLQMKAEERQSTMAQQQELLGGAMADGSYLERADEKSDLTRWQQDLAEDVDLFVHGLKREIYDQNQGGWIKQSEFVGVTDGKEVWRPMPPMMNKLGITTVKNLILLNVSRNLIMSNYSEEQIFRKLRTNVINFVSFLAENYRRFAIDKRDLSAIVQMYKDIIEPTHWRCLNNGERNYLNTINKRVEAYTENAQNTEKKSFFGG